MVTAYRNYENSVQATPGQQTYGRGYLDKQRLPLSNPNSNKLPHESVNVNSTQKSSSPETKLIEGYISKNENINGNKIFTREDIAQMKPDVFKQNEAAIMEQARNGQIKSAKPDYENFQNPHSGSRKIYTREEIAKMSTKDYSKNEKEIFAQMNSIGIPNQADLPKSINLSGDSEDGRWITVNGRRIFVKK